MSTATVGSLEQSEHQQMLDLTLPSATDSFQGHRMRHLVASFFAISGVHSGLNSGRTRSPALG